MAGWYHQLGENYIFCFCFIVFFLGFCSPWHCLVGFTNVCGICEEENVWRWFLEAFHLGGVSVGDLERGGTSTVPDSVHL